MNRKYILLIVIALCVMACDSKLTQMTNRGAVFGTTYEIIYDSPNGRDLHEQIEKEMDKVNKSLSPFDSSSIISKVNRNIETDLDDYFLTVFRKAREVSEYTDGTFDITVAPLVNVWGFGFGNKERVTPELIDSLLQFVGYDKINVVDGRIVKENPGVILSCSAIAKGFACDRVAALLAKNGCVNYMVEIGGEVVTKGFNSVKKREWRPAVRLPEENPLPGASKYKAILKMNDKGIATSGNYLNFYEENGERYGHTINPKTGYPALSNLLSVTVIADDCMTADAYATAFMVWGFDKAVEMSNQFNNLDVYFIYDDAGEYKTWMSEGFKKFLYREME
jgi:Membrane-associated lipoprotein involved in thiamine biosynthesis